jgi:hypothetical protein
LPCSNQASFPKVDEFVFSGSANPTDHFPFNRAVNTRVSSQRQFRRTGDTVLLKG